ncbi:centrosomal protein of 97 kDa [Plodia interpunctella]|uniref:centrosomal protein of 97 kDa n=1 Tax=Plodia interpunctella TaxID=58824 RepID=UPI0023684FBD|nr:centrosomal protein of 97 kDa [Plodia interpunctella]
MDDCKSDTLDLSRRELKKIEKAPPEESNTIINLVLDQNELQRLDNIDTYSRVENLSICNNFLLRMHGVSRLTNIRILALNNNGILQIEGLKDLIYLKVLKLAGNSIKSIEHLNHNMHLEQLDLSNNQISFVADISYLKSLKHLNLERNRIIDLRQCDRYLPANLEHLGLAHNNIHDLNEISHLVHLNKLDSFTMQGNPCVAMAGKDKLGFDYRPFVLNWILSVKSIDGFVVSAIESLKAEWLYSQGKGRHFHAGQHQELCEYLANTCPLTADALETEDQRKLRLILSKAQHHQQQLKDTNHSPLKPKLQSPRMQSRIAARHMGRSPERLTSSYHAALARNTSPSPRPPADTPAAMTQSFDCGLFDKREKSESTPTPPPQQPQLQKPINQSLEAASKMVPVPESLMSPDYQDPIYDIQKTIPKPSNHSVNSVSNTSSQSSNSSIQEERPHRQITQPTNIHKNLKGSPKLTKSATSSPKMKRLEQRKGSLSSVKNEKVNGVKNEIDTPDRIDPDKLEIIKLASNQRRQKNKSVESMAAVTIQKMWRGYRSRNLNKDTLRILHAIQAARARQHIQRLTCDMEATKAALESERKIQQLQMQAINALWKKVSTLQVADTTKRRPSESEDNTEALRQLSETCASLQSQVEALHASVRELACGARVRCACACARACQTDVTAASLELEERFSWLRRPQSLALSAASAPATSESQSLDDVVDTPADTDSHNEKPNEMAALDIERTESVIEEKPDTEPERRLDEQPEEVIAD